MLNLSIRERNLHIAPNLGVWAQERVSSSYGMISGFLVMLDLESINEDLMTWGW